MRKQNGFTLIEIAIVLVIIGLLLGGVLKGQELITSARVRNLISNQDGVKAAYFGFLDRYRALPGDYSGATVNIPNCTGCQNGDNNGQITTNGAILESISAWEHLSKAGFITGSYIYAAVAASTNTPVNPYGSLVQLIYDTAYQDGASGTGPIRHNLKTGNNIPSRTIAVCDFRRRRQYLSRMLCDRHRRMAIGQPQRQLRRVNAVLTGTPASKKPAQRGLFFWPRFDLVHFLVHNRTMIKLNIHQAKTHLSRYLARLKDGETLVICKRNTPIAEVRALPQAGQRKRPIGLAKGKLKVLPSFFEPLPDDIIAAFEGEER